jgi:hypothetical protein
VRKRLLLLVVAVALVGAPSAQADVGIRLTQLVAHRGGWIRGIGDGSGLPIYLAPKRFAPERLSSREPRSKGTPGPPFVLLGHFTTPATSTPPNGSTSEFLAFDPASTGCICTAARVAGP